jgi:hypothetical protein
LLCIVDMTLIDGMAVARESGAALDIRLLDACGDCVAKCLPHLPHLPHLPDGASIYQATSDAILAADQVGRRATAIHLLVMGNFGLPGSALRGAERATP